MKIIMYGGYMQVPAISKKPPNERGSQRQVRKLWNCSEEKYKLESAGEALGFPWTLRMGAYRGTEFSKSWVAIHGSMLT